jgi:hypothetical protein
VCLRKAFLFLLNYHETCGFIVAFQSQRAILRKENNKCRREINVKVIKKNKRKNIILKRRESKNIFQEKKKSFHADRKLFPFNFISLHFLFPPEKEKLHIKYLRYFQPDVELKL